MNDQRPADPDCEYCGGSGERYWHTEDCRSDFCALAGGIEDCLGQVGPCPCGEVSDPDIQRGG